MPPAPLTETWTEALVRGFRVRPTILFLIAAMNTAIALLVWVEDPRPFWHPFVSVQLSGFAVAYCVNVAAPWNKRHPIPRLALAVAVGSLLALVLIVIVKQYDLVHITTKWRSFVGNFFSAFFIGLFVSLFFFVRERDARAQAALHRSEAERNLLAKQAVEARTQADAGPGRAALPVQHARVGAVPDRDRPAAGLEAARPPDRLPARGASGPARGVEHAAPRVRTRARLSRDPRDAHGTRGSRGAPHCRTRSPTCRSRRTC